MLSLLLTNCQTTSSTSYGPNGINVEDLSGQLGTLYTDAMTCNWSRNGDVATCALSEAGKDVSGIACTSSIVRIYKRVEVVVW